ncbi:MAG: FmdB family transcriptional regulator [Gemmatimonadetes bacterium]|nr:FmdB family transcriptional regulator [Thermoleophilaceae bacterium]MBA3585339.1 FmdB family transcriptional regulator [Gemmatimonadota bacterium]
MPIYEYRCDNGHTFEAVQRMIDEPLSECTVCEAPVQRVFHPVAVHFKGSGFYTTDYGKKKAGASSEAGPPSESKDSSSDSKSSSDSRSSSDSKSSDSKSSDSKTSSGSSD